jgi:hypothetical protein
MHATPDAQEHNDESIDIDRSEDQALLGQSEEGWDDLAVLKDELAMTLLGFVVEIERITNSPELLSSLGAKRG